jgi:hypothetical protein
MKQEDIDDIIEKIKQDVEEQKQLLVEQNPYKNQTVDLMMFRKTTSDKKCETCIFRDVCQKLD